MPPVTKPARRNKSPRMTRDDWLDAAFKAVIEGGFDNLRVLALADTLGVTRGSFYWHFDDHAALVAALLARWQAREVDLDRQLNAPTEATAIETLEHLLEVALAHAGPALENMRFELALRALGLRDPAVAAMLLAVDELRMALFERKFRQLTGSEKKARELAALFYLTIVGSYQALGRPTNPPGIRDYLKGLIADYLIRQQVPGAFARPAPAATRAPASRP